MSAARELRDKVDAAADAVTQAKEYLRQAEDRLAQARKAFLDEVLKEPVEATPAGFSAPLSIQYCAVCRDGLGTEQEHNTRDILCRGLDWVV